MDPLVFMKKKVELATLNFEYEKYENSQRSHFRSGMMQ
jgi:hypothetical protein